MHVDLNRCLFCGAKDAPHLTDSVTLGYHEGLLEAFGYMVNCCAAPDKNGCGATSGIWPTENEAINAWNQHSCHAEQTLKQLATMLGVTGNLYRDVPLALRALQVRLREKSQP